MNGFTLGDDKLGIIGNESFHPNAAGHGALYSAASAQWGATLGHNPNDRRRARPKRVAGRGAPRGRRRGRPSSTARARGARCWSPSGDGHGRGPRTRPPNTDLRVTLEPLTTVVGSGRTDADGDAEIPIRLGASTAPGCT